MERPLVDYFSEGYNFYLKNVSYEVIDQIASAKSILMKCVDTITVDNQNDMIVLLFTRRLFCDPKALYEISVTFGAQLPFNEDSIHDIDVDKVDWADEFKKDGSFVLDNLVGRSSHLIADLTSSFGQPPIITPPSIVEINEE